MTRFRPIASAHFEIRYNNSNYVPRSTQCVKVTWLQPNDVMLVRLAKNTYLIIDVCRIELGSGTTGASRVSVLHTKNLDVNSEGLIVDVTYFDNGNTLIMIYFFFFIGELLSGELPYR